MTEENENVEETNEPVEGLQAVLAELHGRLPARVPAAAAAHDLAVLDALGSEHQRPPP